MTFLSKSDYKLFGYILFGVIVFAFISRIYINYSDKQASTT